MWRPRSDVGRIQVRDVEFTFTDGTPDSVRLHIRQPKETNNKSIQLGLIQDEEMCSSKFISVRRIDKSIETKFS